MKRTVLEKIVALKGMIFRLEHPDLVMEEMKNIFKTLDQLEDKEMERKALDALVDLSVDMMKKINPEDLSDILDSLVDINEIKRKEIEVSVRVEEYNDAVVIRIDKKISYSELMKILKKANKDFVENQKYIYGLSYDKQDKYLEISYLKSSCKDIIVDMSKWNMNNEVAKVYIEGFSEYIQK